MPACPLPASLCAVFLLSCCGWLFPQSITVLPGVQVVAVDNQNIREISGIAESRSIPNTLWAHEDSGEDPAFYGIDLSSGLIHSRIELQNAPAVDWEDMTLCPKPGGGHYLFFGDIGDNGANRNTGVDIIRITEPTNQGNTTLGASDYQVKRVTYPGIIFFREEDAESLFADPLTGDLYIIQKLTPGRLFRLPAAEFDAAGVFTLETLGNINAPLSRPTAADISADGRFIIIRNSDDGGTTAYLFIRDVTANQSIASALQGTPLAVTLQSESQGEAIAWAADGSGFYSLSEGENKPVWFYAVNEITEIKHPENNAHPLLLYPNPTKGVIQLSLSANESTAEVTALLTNNSGQVIRRQVLTGGAGRLMSISMDGLAAGMYYLQLFNAEKHWKGSVIIE